MWRVLIAKAIMLHSTRPQEKGTAPVFHQKRGASHSGRRRPDFFWLHFPQKPGNKPYVLHIGRPGNGGGG
jgi:hypothetical protein